MKTESITAFEDRIVQWFADRGITGYKDRIENARAQVATVTSWGVDPVVVAKEVAAIKQEAVDRYNDWVTDPLD